MVVLATSGVEAEAGGGLLPAAVLAAWADTEVVIVPPWMMPVLAFRKGWTAGKGPDGAAGLVAAGRSTAVDVVWVVLGCA